MLVSRTFASLRKHRNYRLFFAGQIVSASGTWMQDTALPWLVIERTHSPVAVGLLLFCRYIPFTVCALPSGILADRFDNRRLLIATQSASMTVAGLLALLTYLDAAPLWAIFLLALLGGTAVVVDNPTRNAMIFQLVGPEELPNAVALNSSLMNAARLVGPSLAGVVIAAAGVGICFALNAASFLAVLAALVLMRTSELHPVAKDPNRPRGLRAIAEGVAYARSSPTLRVVLATTAVVGLAGFNFRVFVPVLASRTLHSGATTFGLLYSSFGAGACGGALFAAGIAAPTLRKSLLGLIGLSGGMVLMAPLHSVWAVCPLLVLVGFCFTAWSATNQALLQLGSPDALRGRVLSLYLAVFGGLMPVGALLSGWLTAVGGTELAFAAGGGAGLVVVGVIAAQAPRHEAPPAPAVLAAEADAP